MANRQPFARFLWLAGASTALLHLFGCYTILPPGVQVVERDRTGWVNPDDFSVRQGAYPEFQAVRRIEVPPDVYLQPLARKGRYWLAPIEITDRWRVSHRVGQRLLIYSEDYQKRECELLREKMKGTWEAGGRRLDGTCVPSQLFHIFVLEDGTVSGGWELLKNPERVLFARDRMTRFNDDVSVDNAGDWGPQPVFQPITAPNSGVQPTPPGAADARR